MSLFVFLGVSLLAQGSEPARRLYQEAEQLLQLESPTAFDKLEAFNLLKESQKVLSTLANDTTDLKIKTASEIVQLTDFFAQYQNGDSILNTTRFFPDSIFQASPLYTSEFKALIGEYLSIRYRVVERAFVQFKYLNFDINNSDNNALQLKVDNYWPIEVWELEQWLQQQETINKKFKKEASDQLIRNQLQLRLDRLTYQESKRRYESTNEELSAEIVLQESNAQDIAARYQRLRNIGIGILLLLSIVTIAIWRKQKSLLESKNQSLLEEKKRSEDLLLNILPAEVVHQLKNKKAANARLYESVGILFTDFQNFSQISKNLPPKELVKELDYCFTHFDQIIEKHHLQKIKTIGDAYMCAAGLYTRGNQYIIRMIAAALEIQEFLENRKLQKSLLGGYFFNARIGIHVGSVVAGVIGTKKIAFDIWGDTVNVAQQMEHHSEVGGVNISSDVYELAKEAFECSYRGEITAKNGKTYHMYGVIKEKETTST